MHKHTTEIKIKIKDIKTNSIIGHLKRDGAAIQLHFQQKLCTFLKVQGKLLLCTTKLLKPAYVKENKKIMNIELQVIITLFHSQVLGSRDHMSA